MKRIETECPGCGRQILVPAVPTPDTWLEAEYWAIGCGGVAPLASEIPPGVRLKRNTRFGGVMAAR